VTSPDETSGTGELLWRELARNRTAVTIATVTVLLAATFVTLTLRRPELATFVPSSREPTPAGGELVGPLTYTVDARSSDRWQFFSFSQGTVVTDPRPFEWDLAFRRFQVIVNGGDRFPGMGGVIGLRDAPFDSVSSLPEAGYQGTEAARGDSISPPLEDWYDYSFLSHLLSPTPRVYAVRTADGRYAKFRFLGYYCPGAQPGCVTFEYVYQGKGGREVLSFRSGISKEELKLDRPGPPSLSILDR